MALPIICKSMDESHEQVLPKKQLQRFCPGLFLSIYFEHGVGIAIEREYDVQRNMQKQILQQ